MARNWEKYMYVELAIPRNSAWYPLLEAEAAAKGLPLAQIALERLAVAYLDGGHTASTPGTARSQAPASLTPGSSRSGTALPAGEEAEPQLSEEQAAHNAAAFLDNGGFL